MTEEEDFYGWKFYWFPNILRSLNFGYGIWWYGKDGKWLTSNRRFYGFNLALGIFHIEYRRKSAYEADARAVLP